METDMPEAPAMLMIRHHAVPDVRSRGRSRRSIRWRFWIAAGVVPLAALLLASAAIRLLELDLAVARSFFSPGSDYPFSGLRSPFCRFMYRFGPLPGIAFGACAIVVWILAARRSAFSTSTRIAGFCSVLLLVAPMLVVNLGLKTWWGRPRPSQIEDFGGNYTYAPLGAFGEGPTNGSFSSGHAAIAFYLMAPGFFFIRRRAGLAALLLGGGCAAGIVMGAVRIVQGAHFLSDVIWSGAIVYFTGLVLARLLHVDSLDPSQFRALIGIVKDDTSTLLRFLRRRPAPSAGLPLTTPKRRVAGAAPCVIERPALLPAPLSTGRSNDPENLVAIQKNRLTAAGSETGFRSRGTLSTARVT